MAEKTIRVIDSELRLIPYYKNYDVTFDWYQDPDVCKQVDNLDHPYTMERLDAMYSFLDANGSCYYIEYQGVLVGDVTLRDNHEVCIVVSKKYQNRHIGRRCVVEMLRLAKEKTMDSVKANIYAFNTQSQRMFLSVGFREVAQEWYEYKINESNIVQAEAT